MTDRIEFSQNIGIQTSLQIGDCFNEVMAIFNLLDLSGIGSDDITSVTGDVNGNDTTFFINCRTVSKAKELSDRLVHNNLYLYDNYYTLSNTRDKKKITAFMRVK